MILDRFKEQGRVAVVTGRILEVDGGTVDSNWPFSMPSGLSGPKGD